MTKEEIEKSSDLEIAYRIIEDTLDNVNSNYLNSDWPDEVTHKTEGYLDGLVFCLDVLKKVNGVKDAILKEDKNNENNR
jgi:hypothetical protein